MPTRMAPQEEGETAVSPAQLITPFARSPAQSLRTALPSRGFPPDLGPRVPGERLQGVGWTDFTLTPVAASLALHVQKRCEAKQAKG